MSTCIVCDNTHFIALYDNLLLKCPTCGYIRPRSESKLEYIEEYYTEKYFLGGAYQNYLADKEVIQNNFVRRLDQIHKFVNLERITNCLEIGAAYGFFGQVLKRRVNCEYIGYEIVPEAVAYACEQLHLNIVCNDFMNSEIDQNGKPYSDIFMWDVIEHLAHPEMVLEKVGRETCKGSRLYITTGDIESLLARMQKKNWRMLHESTHRHFFAKRSLNRILNRYGFKILFLNYTPVYRTIKQIYYSLIIINKKPGRLHVSIYKRIPPNWYLKINLFDILFVIAEKT